MNSLPSANFNTLSSLGASNLSSTSDSLPVTHTTQAIHAESAIDYTSEYGDNDHLPTAEVDLSPLPQTTQTTPSKSSPPQISPEPVDLSDAISKIDVEMERLSWKKTQGRDYLVRTFGKKSRQQLTNDELLQFLSHLKSLPTPYSQLENDDFF